MKPYYIHLQYNGIAFYKCIALLPDDTKPDDISILLTKSETDKLNYLINEPSASDKDGKEEPIGY